MHGRARACPGVLGRARACPGVPGRARGVHGACTGRARAHGHAQGVHGACTGMHRACWGVLGRSFAMRLSQCV